ncbi:MAG: efflux RND transporter periplasmic adaptor subunit [Candidatus Neomarinimicrobiota bacterium]
MGMDRIIEKKKWTWKKISLIAVAVIFIASIVYLFLFQFKTSALNVERERLTIATISRGPFREFIPVVGNVLPINTFYLSAVEGGRVEEIYLEAGSMVKKGDKILKLGNTSLLLDIMWREAELFQQSNNLRNTQLSMEQQRLSLKSQVADIEFQLQQQKRIFDRSAELYKKEMLSRQEYEAAQDQYEYLKKRRELTAESQKNDMEFRKAQIESLRSSLKRMEDNLSIAKQKLDNLTVKAPISGHLTALDAEIGQTKSPGERLGQIDVLDGFKVRANIDEHYLPRVENGKTGEFDLSGETFQLIVKKVFPEVKDGRFEVDLEFTDRIPAGITRGQTLHIRLDLGGISEAILLPRGGFYQTTGGNWIYILSNDEKTAFKRTIKLGRQNPQFYEILEGLQPGERVITSAYDNYNNIDNLILK